MLLLGNVPTLDESGEQRNHLVKDKELCLSADEGSLDMYEQEKPVRDGTEYLVGMKLQRLTNMDERIAACTPDGRIALVHIRLGCGEAMVLPCGINRAFCSTAELMHKLLTALGCTP